MHIMIPTYFTRRLTFHWLLELIERVEALAVVNLVRFESDRELVAGGLERPLSSVRRGSTQS